MVIMKEQQIIFEVSTEKLKALEEGLLQKVPESKTKFERKADLCTKWIRFLHLIFLLELMLFLAGSCYIIFQRNSPQVSENKDRANAFEKYIKILEAQKSQPTTEELVKFDIIGDQFNNLLEDVGPIKEQESMQNKISATDADNTMPKNTQNFINVERDNSKRTSDFNIWPQMRFELNKEFMKDSMPWQLFSTKYIDDTTDKNAKIIPFFERLQDIAEIEANLEADLRDFQNKNDFTHETNRVTLNSQESHESDVSDKFQSLKLHVKAISNPDDLIDRGIGESLTNNLENWIQKLSDVVEDVIPDDRSEKTFFSDKIDKANNDLEQGYVICLPDQPNESSDMSQKDKDFSISQSVATQKNSEQMENKSSENISARNKDKPNVDDSNVFMSASSDASTSKSDDSFLFNVLISNMENTERIQHSPEIAANIEADEKHDSTENVNDSFENWQDGVEHLTSNDDKFQWSNAPARFADDLQPGPMDIPKLNDAKTYSSLSANPEIIQDFIPGSECQVQIVRNILIIKCPAVNFDEEWNVPSIGAQTIDFPDVNSFDVDLFDYFYDDQWGEKLISQDNVPEATDAVESQETTPSIKMLNTSPEKIGLDVAREISKVIQDDAVPDSNEEEIPQGATTTSSSSYEVDSDNVDYVDNEKLISWLKTLNSTQQEALNYEDHDVSDYEHLKTSTEISEDKRITSDIEKKLASIFNNETTKLIDYVKSIKPSSSEDDNMDAIRNIPPYTSTSPSPDSWQQQYDDAKKVVEEIRNREFPYALWSSSNDRKKRMAVTELQSVENTIDESKENVEVVQNLKKFFQRMEILAAYIDRLHERYLFHSKLDNDYVSNEFPEEIKKY